MSTEACLYRRPSRTEFLCLAKCPALQVSLCLLRSVTAEGALQHAHGLRGRSDRLVLFYSSAVLGVSLKPDLWADLLTAPFLSQVLLILSPSLPSTPNQTLLLLPFYSMPLSLSFASYRISLAHPHRSQGTNGAPNPMKAKQIHEKAQSMYHRCSEASPGYAEGARASFSGTRTYSKRRQVWVF